jgi:hypothetical protein
MIVLDPGEITRVVKQPQEVQKEKQAAAEEANLARLGEQRLKNEAKKRMKVGNQSWPVAAPLQSCGMLVRALETALPSLLD